MRVIFMGTPDFAVPTLRRLILSGYEIAAVYTQPPRPAGRGQGLRKSAVHMAAEGAGIEVRSPVNFKAESERSAFSALGADVGVVVAYGLLLPKPILDAPKYGCLNLHGSLLPRWRGAAPMQRALMAGDKETGVMVMKMDEGLDTGPVGLVAIIPIAADMNAGELHDQMALRGADLMAEGLEKLQAGKLDFSPQTGEGVSYAKKIEKAEQRIDFARPATEVHNQVRALSPIPGGFGMIEDKKGTLRLKLLRTEIAEGNGAAGEIIGSDFTIACQSGAVRVLDVQREGGKPMQAADFLRGAGDLAGRRFL